MLFGNHKEASATVHKSNCYSKRKRTHFKIINSRNAYETWHNECLLTRDSAVVQEFRNTFLLFFVDDISHFLIKIIKFQNNVISLRCVILVESRSYRPGSRVENNADYNLNNPNVHQRIAKFHGISAHLASAPITSGLP